MSDSGSSFEDLARSARLLQTVKYTNVASFTLLIVDYLYTLDLEVQLIWQARWGYGKILYLLSRYQTFFDVALVIYYATAEGISDDACHKIYSVASWATAFGIGWAEAILVLRTFALSGNNRKLLTALSVLYVGIYAAVIVVLAIFLKSLVYGAPPLPTVHGCYPVAGSSILFADFALLLVFEASIMVITLVIGIRRFRHTHNRLVTTLYTDGIFYFVLLAFISLGNIIVLLAGPPEFVDLLNTFQRVMHSLLSCRILLHVRKAASDNALPWTARSPSELDYSFNLGSNLRFRHDQTLDAVTEVGEG